MKKPKKLTPKDLGLVPETKLSETYAHTRNDFKIVSDHVIGFAVWGGGKHAGYQVVELRDATIYKRVGKVRHIITTLEHGRRLVDLNDAEAMDDNTIAASVSYLIGVLQARATRREARVRTERKKRA